MNDNFHQQKKTRKNHLNAAVFMLLILATGLLMVCGCATGTKGSANLGGAPNDDTNKVAIYLKAFNNKEKENITPTECACLNPEPRIHSIGNSSILVFDPEHKKLQIVVEGRDLHVPPCTIANVKVWGYRGRPLSI